MNNKSSIRTKLFYWYGGSILLIALFFWFGVHIYAIAYAEQIFIFLLIALSLIGFVVISKITGTLSKFARVIHNISSRNLNERVEVVGDDEVGQLAKSFNNLLKRIETSFNRERQFIGDVAHEMKTPIATMRSNIEVGMSKIRSGKEYRRILEESLTDLNNLTETLNDVLDLAWNEANREKPLKQKVNLSELVEEIEEIAAKLGITKKIMVKSEIEKGIEVYGNREKLARVLINLVDNGIKYNKVEGMITLSLYSRKDKAIIVIKDTGNGIKAKELTHIFERFYRGSNTSRIEGNGLGLAISKSILQLHRGKISVKSRISKGTEFIMELPRV